MRFMMLVRATKESEAGILPGERFLRAMAKYNEELAKAGVLIDLSGLQPSSKGARVRFSRRKPIVLDGPFPDTRELIAGYWIIDVDSMDTAIEWAKRVPFTDPDAEIEIRPFYDLVDFPSSGAVERSAKLSDSRAEN
jgi:hypothetical protein